MAALRDVVVPARFTLVAIALSVALAGALGRLVVEVPQVLPLGAVGRLPPQLLPEELREELNEDDEERPPEKLPLEPRARLSLAGQVRARERNSAIRMWRECFMVVKKVSG